MKPAAIILPIVILAAGYGLARLIVEVFTPEPEIQPLVFVPPTVEAVTVAPETVAVRLRSQGTVQPRSQSRLTSEVAGRIVAVAPQFVVGGSFSAGDELLQIDRSDFEARLAQAEAALAQAKVTLLEETARAEQAAEDWLGLGQPLSAASPLSLRTPQVQRAQANLLSAQAEVDRAQRDLERTTIRAPFSGRISERNADLGERVNAGSPLAVILATDPVEVRLPLELAAWSQLDVAPDGTSGNSPAVTLSARLNGQRYTWEGKVVRTEAAIDSRTRLAYVIAELTDPFSTDPQQPDRPALQFGQFLEAEITGRPLLDVFRLPRSALRPGDELWVAVPPGNATDDGAAGTLTLDRRTVASVWRNTAEVYLREGLRPGESVIISPVPAVRQGMPIRLAQPAPATPRPEFAP